MRNLLPLALLAPLLLPAEDLPRQALEILTTNCTARPRPLLNID